MNSYSLLNIYSDGRSWTARLKRELGEELARRNGTSGKKAKIYLPDSARNSRKMNSYSAFNIYSDGEGRMARLMGELGEELARRNEKEEEDDFQPMQNQPGWCRGYLAIRDTLLVR